MIEKYYIYDKGIYKSYLEKGKHLFIRNIGEYTLRTSEINNNISAALYDKYGAYLFTIILKEIDYELLEELVKNYIDYRVYLPLDSVKKLVSEVSYYVPEQNIYYIEDEKSENIVFVSDYKFPYDPITLIYNV